ncbi:hypothetical protein [Nocardia sp. NPDC060259]|uniref:hypothetical protein n=1 Tax=Nocardia sp. NPDC060259 TaxID=3347088 RepID=UPI003654C3FB
MSITFARIVSPNRGWRVLNVFSQVDRAGSRRHGHLPEMSQASVGTVCRPACPSDIRGEQSRAMVDQPATSRAYARARAGVDGYRAHRLGLLPQLHPRASLRGRGGFNWIDAETLRRRIIRRFQAADPVVAHGLSRTNMLDH